MTQKNPSDATQILLMGKDISQIQRDLSSVAADIKKFNEARYVTSNEMSLAIQAAITTLQGENKISFDSISKEVGNIQRILWLIFSSFIVIIIGSVGRLILKV